MDSSYSCLKDDSVSYPSDDLPSTFKPLCEFSTAAVKKFLSLAKGSAPVAVKHGCVCLVGSALQRFPSIHSKACVVDKMLGPSRSPEYQVDL